MRRVVRADSPEVVRVADASPCFAAESGFRELDHAFLQTQARIWLGEVLHVRFDEETSIADLLADGELLFQVSKVVWKMLLRKQAELKHSKVHIYERTSSGKSDGRYMPYPKVDSFLKICQILGLTGIDLFSPSDVVEKRDVRRVCMCIRSFSKKTRLKNLDVPDFDSVTYTIAMPTELVGGICRNLEQSQCSSSNSTGYDACMDSREICRQRSFSGDHSRLYDSYLDYDEAESTLKGFEFQSPKSDISYDVAKPTHTFENISSDRNSIFDGSPSELHSESQLECLDKNEDDNMGVYSLAVSTDSPCSITTENGNDDFRVLGHTKSSCAECQGNGVRSSLAHIGELMLPTLSSENGYLIKNTEVDSFQSCRTFEDSPFMLDEQLATNEGNSCKRYVDTIIESKDLGNSKLLSCEREEFNEALSGCSSPHSSGQILKVNCASGYSNEVIFERAVLFEETSKGFDHTTEAHNGKPSRSNSMRSLDIAHTEVSPKPWVMNIEGNKENNGSSTQRMGENHIADDVSILGKCISLQPHTSDMCLNTMDDGDFVQSVHSNCEGLINVVKRESRDKVVDTKVSSVPSFNVPEDKLDSNGCSINNLYGSEVHHVKEIGESDDKLEISVNKHASIFSKKAINTNLYLMDADKDSSLVTPRKTSSTAGTDATYRRSICESELSEVFDLSLLESTAYDHEELHPYVETEMWDFLGSLSSTAGHNGMSLGTLNDLQLYGSVYDVSHAESSSIKKDFMLPNNFENPCDHGTGQSTDHSSTCTTVSDDCVENDGTTVSDDCVENEGKCDLSVNISFYPITGTSEEANNSIIDSMVPIKNVSSTNLLVDPVELLETLNAASSVNLTNNGLPVGKSKTENDGRDYVKHCSSTSFDFDGVESQIVSLECNIGTDVKIENKVTKEISTCSPLYDRNNDLNEEVENLCEKLNKKDVFGQNTNTCSPLTERGGKDDNCDSFLVKESCHSEESTKLIGPKLPLVGDAFTSMEYKSADETEKEKDTGIGEGVTELAKIKGSDVKDDDRVAGELKNSGKKVLTSVAGGLSLVGALFLFLTLRKKRGRERNSNAVVPVHTQTPSQEGAVQKRVEIGNYGGFYPAERFGF